MRLIEEQGDLFELDSKYVLIHCISQDCEMGAGIATEFKRRFGMKEYLLETIQQVPKYYPCSILYPFKKQKVINMVTKAKYWHKPNYDTFEKALDEAVKICIEYNFKYLAMPKIGCGLDRLQWDKVKKIIEDKFKDLDVEIVVRYL